MKKEFDKKILALWKQCIEWKKRDIEFYKKTKNKLMVDFTKDVLKSMEKIYEDLCKKYKTP